MFAGRMKERNMKSFLLAEKVKALRLQKAWSQAQLSEIASLSIRTIQRIELDGRCSQESLLALASAFEIDVKEFTSLIRESLEKYSFYIFGLKISAEWLKPNTALILSMLLIFPACYFISSAILKYIFEFPYLFDPLLIFYSSKEILWWFNIISPAVFLFGLGSSIILNLFVMFSIRIWKDNSKIKSDIIFTPKFANLFIAGVSFIFLTMLFAYIIGENFNLR
jgi:transcriptional regulator with XRE-family HTH domain